MPTSLRPTIRAAAARQWWLLLAGVAAGLGAGLAVQLNSTPVYAASIAVLVQPVPTAASPGQITGGPINLDTEAQLLASTQTAETAARLSGGGASAAQFASAVTVEVAGRASVLRLRFEAATPAAAQAGARAFAQAYLSNRSAAARDELASQAAATNDRIGVLNQQLAALDAELAELDPDAPRAQTLRARRQTLTAGLSTLTGRVTDLATTPVNAGRVIQDAALPDRPVRPRPALLLGLGGAGGLVLGGVAGAARELLARRVRGGDDVTRDAGLPLLAELTGELPGPRTLAPRVFAPHQGPGRAFHRLRNEVVAALAETDQVILVTGASPGRASTVVAANLATALARADNEVILVGANVPELGADRLLLSTVFDIADVPGLTDVLTRRAALERALQPAPRAPRLRIIAPGATASSAGLLQSEAVRASVQALRQQARYVVVEAPSLASGPDAQSLAGLADVAILVAEAGATGRWQVADAARQLRVVGTRVLGAVVLPPLAAPPAEELVAAVAPQEHAARPGDAWINPASASILNAPTALQPVLPDGPAPRPAAPTS